MNRNYLSLFALTTAFLPVVLSAMFDLFLAGRVEASRIHLFAPLMFEQKNQGSVLARLAFQQPDLLPVYGSSELDFHSSNHASALFRDYPTGFTIYAVGKPGTTCLVILQDLAAVGPAMYGKRVVISLSPIWFFDKEANNASSYAGNFSRLHAYQLAYNLELGADVKQMAAKQMLIYPETVNSDPLLQFALERLADGSPLSLVLYYASLPLGELQSYLLLLQDHWETVLLIRDHLGNNAAGPRQAKELDWPALLAQASNEYATDSNNNPFGFENGRWKSQFQAEASRDKNSRSEAGALSAVRHSNEWTNLELILKAIKTWGGEPLLLSLPMDGPYYNYVGISDRARSAYYDRLHELATRYHVRELDFRQLEGSKGLVIDPASHLSMEGWIFYDQALDSFFHGRPMTGLKGQGASAFPQAHYEPGLNGHVSLHPMRTSR
jgi:D-alanine transfer protein